MLAAPHVALIESLRGPTGRPLRVSVTADLSRFRAIYDYTLANPVPGKSLHLNQMLDPVYNPDPSPDDTLLVIASDGDLDVACVGGRLRHIRDLQRDIESGRLHYGRQNAECQYRFKKKTGVGALIGQCPVLVGAGWWRHDNYPSALVPAVWRILLASALEGFAIRERNQVEPWDFDYVISVQKRYILDRLGWDKQGWEEAAHIYYGDDQQFLVQMDRNEATWQAARTDGYAEIARAAA